MARTRDAVLTTYDAEDGESTATNVIVVVVVVVAMRTGGVVVVAAPAQPPRVTASVVRRAYRACALVGRGAWGRVYRGVARATGARVAIKVMRATEELDVHVTGNDERRALERLAATPATRACEHVVRLLEYYALRSRAVLVLEYVDGVDLHARLTAAPLTEAAARTYARQLALALTACHAAGVVHRDVKPENLMVAGVAGDDVYAGRLVLVDFGLALVVLDGADTATDVPYMQTTEYAAPETLDGAATYTRAVDVWSAGAVVAEMLTRRMLFRGASVERVRENQARYCARPYVNRDVAAAEDAARADRRAMTPPLELDDDDDDDDSDGGDVVILDDDDADDADDVRLAWAKRPCRRDADDMASQRAVLERVPWAAALLAVALVYERAARATAAALVATLDAAP
jgi:serine/threonine protein kinase